MEYEKIIIDLLVRVKELEDRVTILEGKESNKISNVNATSKEEISGGQKYRALSLYLKNSNLDHIKMTFTEIEEVLGFSLPPCARAHRENWSNTTTISLPCSWLKVGYKSVEVDMAGEYVVFEKDLF